MRTGYQGAARVALWRPDPGTTHLAPGRQDSLGHFFRMN